MRIFHKSIIFTKTPLAGYFQYKDIFQIYPANLDNMPKSVFQDHYPVVLEYWIDDDEKIVVTTDFEELKDLYSLTATTLTKEDKILNILTVFTNHLFFKYYDNTGTWGLPILDDNAGEKANAWSSKWNFNLFQWPELAKQLIINEFTKPAIEEVKYIEHYSYYFKNPNFDYYIGKEITFPITIHKVLDSYYSKEEQIQSILNTAISYSAAAMEFRQHKKTISMISSFVAMEAMINLDYKETKAERCELCGQLQYKVSKKFKDYLSKYIGNSKSDLKKFNAYYSLRSKIIHTGQRLKTESLYANISKKEKDDEFLSRMEILQMGKIAIIHWLLKNTKSIDTQRV